MAGIRPRPSKSVASKQNPKAMSLAHLLELLKEAQAIDDATIKDISSREDFYRAKFLREKYGATAAQKNTTYSVSAAELITAARVVHPKSKNRLIDEDVLAQFVAIHSGKTYEKIDPLELDMKLITQTMSKGFAQRHLMLPLRRVGEGLTLAIADPMDAEGVDEFARVTGNQVDVVISAKKDIVAIINQVYGFRQAVSTVAKESKSSVSNLQNLEQLVRVRSAEEIDPSDSKIVAAVEYLLNSAFDNRASDIHVEPKREVSKLRLRIDGVLHDIGEIPAEVHPAIVSRIKILARMNIAERRRPQDGRIKTTRGEREIELRVSILPVAFGEKVVIRIFDPQVLLAQIIDLGFTESERESYEEWITRPNGLILVTGPTGSGKTTTLYSTLKYLATPSTNIVTVEDPVEMVYEPLNQVSVQAKIDVTFAKALRSILRQDPDIIMVGEIRDIETATMTVQAALTGHLVFSTLHTSDTGGAITRLLELKVEPFLLSSVLAGIIAQRLMRKVCSECAEEVFMTEEQIQTLSIPMKPGEQRKLPIKKGEGCAKCRHTGLFGRVGVFELMNVSGSVRNLIREGADSKAIVKAATLDGMTSLRQAAIKKLAQGLTTYEEVFRVTADLL
jgi:general secretion pathway protein E